MRPDWKLTWTSNGYTVAFLSERSKHRRSRDKPIDLGEADTPHIMLWIFAQQCELAELRRLIGELRIPAAFPDPKSVPVWASRFAGTVALIDSNWGEYEGPVGSSSPERVQGRDIVREPKLSPSVVTAREAKIRGFQDFIRTLAALGDLTFLLSELKPAEIQKSKVVDLLIATDLKFLLELSERSPVTVRASKADR